MTILHHYDIIKKGKKFQLFDLKKDKLRKHEFDTKDEARTEKRLKELEHQWNSQFSSDRINWTPRQVKRAEALLRKIKAFEYLS